MSVHGQPVRVLMHTMGRVAAGDRKDGHGRAAGRAQEVEPSTRSISGAKATKRPRWFGSHKDVDQDGSDAFEHAFLRRQLAEDILFGDLSRGGGIVHISVENDELKLDIEERGASEKRTTDTTENRHDRGSASDPDSDNSGRMS